MPKRFVPALALAHFALHAVCANRYGFFRDELYYIACGQHLAAGYVDHPPLIAFLARIVGTVGLHSLVAFRLAAALTGAALIVLTARLARALGGDRTAEGLAALAIFAAPLFWANSGLFTMNAFEPLFWTGVSLALVRAAGGDGRRALFALGPIVGFGLLNKHSMAWWVVAVAIGLALGSERRLYRRRELWLAAGIAAALALPNVIWEIVHHFPTLEFMKNAQREKNLAPGPLVLFRDVALEMNPLTAPLWLAGLVSSLFLARLRAARPLGIAFVLVSALVVTQAGKSYYLAPAFPTLFALGAVAFERVLVARWRFAVASVALVSSGAVFVPLVVPILPAKKIPAYMDMLGIEPPRDERHEPAPVPQIIADQFGWRELAERVSTVYSQIPQNEKASTVIFTSNYGEASAIAWFGKGLPSVYSGHNSYFLWGPPPDDRVTVISVGLDRATIETLCPRVEEEPRGLHPLAMPYENEAPILVCHELALPWSTLWAGTRHFI